MRDILFIAIVILCSLIALRRPVFGILAFICFGLLNLHSITWGVGRTFPFAYLTAVSTIVGYFFWSEPKTFPFFRESLLLLALWSMFGLSTISAIHPEAALQQFTHVSKILLMVLLSIPLINNEHRLHMLLRVITLSLGLYGLKCGIFAVISGGNYMVWGPERSFLEANNAIGMALVMNIALLFYCLRIEPHRWLRWIMRAMLIFSYPAVICTFSRGAWLGLALVTGLLILKSKYKFFVIFTAGFIGIMLLPFILSRLPDRVVSRYDDLVNYQNDGSAESRLWNWELCKRVALARPLQGGGFDYYSQEIYAKYYPEFLDRWGWGRVWSCHSVWFTIFSEHGFPGLILWLSLLIACLCSLRRMYFYASHRENLTWTIEYIEMLKITLYAYMLMGTFYDSAYFDLMYQLIAFMIIMKNIVYRIISETSMNDIIDKPNKPVLVS